jgi:hypothetical protein
MERKKYRILMGSPLVTWALTCRTRKREVNIRSKTNFLAMQVCLKVMLCDCTQRVPGPNVSWEYQLFKLRFFMASYVTSGKCQDSISIRT